MAKKNPDMDLSAAFAAKPATRERSQGLFARLLDWLAGKLERRVAAFYLIAAAADGAHTPAPFQMKDALVARSAALRGLTPALRERLRGDFLKAKAPADRARLIAHACHSLAGGRHAEGVFVAALDVALCDDGLPLHKQELFSRMGEQLKLDQAQATRWAALLRQKSERVGAHHEGGLSVAFAGLKGALTPEQALYALIVCAVLAEGGRDNVAAGEFRQLARLNPQFRDLSDEAFAELHRGVFERARAKRDELAADAAAAIPEARRLCAYLQILDAAFLFARAPGKAARFLDDLAVKLALAPEDARESVRLIRMKFGMR